MSLVKSQILKKLTSLYPNFLRKDLEKALNLVFNEIIQTLAKEKNVEIRGFGSFKIRRLKSRIGRNPKDGSRVEVPERKNVHWKMSKELFEKLNKELKHNE